MDSDIGDLGHGFWTLTMRPLLLDLFCGAGGAAEGYHRAGFDVLGVDIRPQPRYPFPFIQGDALKVMSTGSSLINAIHASPPCQRYSIASKRWNGAAEKHPDLVAPVRELLKASGLPYVIENVPGAPLEDPVTLCGSMFDLGVRRHRQFEASFTIATRSCRHETRGNGGGKSKGDWAEAMGIDWMTNREMAQAIPPAYTEFIGQQLMAHLTGTGVLVSPAP